MRLTCAITHIRLCDANHAKIEALDQVAAEYLRLAQQYTTFFCADADPDGYRAPCYESPLSQRWQRVAIQQAAGIAKSWRSNRQRAQDEFAETLLAWQEGEHAPEETPPTWKEWTTPTLRRTVLQANANVATLQPSQESAFAYWLQVATLEKGHPLLLPVHLASYHQRVLANQRIERIDSSVTLTRKPDGWWLTLTYEEDVPLRTAPDAPVVGVDSGMTHFLTTSTGKHYGSFQGKLANAHGRDWEKRRRKAKLRACLKKKGVEQLPSTSNPKLARRTRQEINRAVNDLYRDHPDCQVAYEALHVASMRFKAKRMNAALRASHLAHIPKQLAWGAAKRGIKATPVKSAYTSQECVQCHFVARSNRPTQQTFCCQVCGAEAHADVQAAHNIASRLHDHEVQACKTRQEVKALLERRHQRWRMEIGWS